MNFKKQPAFEVHFKFRGITSKGSIFRPFHAKILAWKVNPTHKMLSYGAQARKCNLFRAFLTPAHPLRKA